MKTYYVTKLKIGTWWKIPKGLHISRKLASSIPYKTIPSFVMDSKITPITLLLEN